MCVLVCISFHSSVSRVQKLLSKMKVEIQVKQLKIFVIGQTEAAVIEHTRDKLSHRFYRTVFSQRYFRLQMKSFASPVAQPGTSSTVLSKIASKRRKPWPSSVTVISWSKQRIQSSATLANLLWNPFWKQFPLLKSQTKLSSRTTTPSGKSITSCHHYQTIKRFALNQTIIFDRFCRFLQIISFQQKNLSAK